MPAGPRYLKNILIRPPNKNNTAHPCSKPRFPNLSDVGPFVAINYSYWIHKFKLHYLNHQTDLIIYQNNTEYAVKTQPNNIQR